LYTAAPILALESATIETSNASGSSGTDFAEFYITFTVTAEGDDIYIASTTDYDDTSTGTDEITAIVDRSGTEAAASSAILSVDGADVVGGWGYYIPEGSTATFSIKITLNNVGGTAGDYRGKIKGIAWDTESDGSNNISWGDDVETWLEDLRTDYVYLVDY